MTDDIVLAAGGVIVRDGAAGAETAVIHRPRYDDWSFPKGKVDPGETFERTALREVLEETALTCRLVRPLATQHYPGKRVRYWEMAVVRETPFIPNAEVDVLRWIPLRRAGEILTHPQDRDLLTEIRTGRR